MSDDSRRIRERLTDPRSVCRQLGLDKGAIKQAGGLSIVCPGHGDKGPSCSVTKGDDGTLRVHCMAHCGLDGDVLTLIAAARGLDIKSDFRRVLEEGARLAGVDLDPRGVASGPPPTKRSPRIAAPTPVAPQAPPEGFGDVAARMLALCPLRSSKRALEYLAARGIAELAAADGWGALPLDVAPLVEALSTSCGAAALVRSGLFQRKGGALRLLWAEHALLIPYRDASGTIVGLQRRLLREAKDGEPKYVHAGARSALYGMERLAAAPPDDPVAYVEGAVDVLALRSLLGARSRPCVVLGVQGLDAWGSAAAELARGRAALVATDADPFDELKGQPGPGDRAAAAWAEELREAGAASIVRLRPEGAKDWAELTEQLVREPAAAAGDIWTEETIAAPIVPDPLWSELARLADEARARGLVPELDSAAIAKVKSLVAGIDARFPARVEFVDRSSLVVPIAAPVYPVPGFPVRAGMPTLFIAFSFSGKTIVLQDLLLGVALGDRVWGYYRAPQARVVHFDYEQGRDETIDRYHRLVRGRGYCLGALDGAPLDVAIHPSANLWTPGAEDIFKRAMDGASVALVDTFAAASPGQDENEADIARGLHMLGRASEATGCAVIVAHHVGKSGVGDASKKMDLRAFARGSTAILAAAGAAYVMGGPKGEPKLVQQAKGRSLGDPQVEDFYLELAPVDCRQPDHERGYEGYRNPVNPGDVGGFSVTYRTVEQVRPPRPANEETLESHCEALRLFFLAEHAKGRGVGSASAASKGAKLRKVDGLAAFDTLRARKIISNRGGRGAADWWILSPLPGSQN